MTAATAIEPDYRVLGAGGFGAVFSPALPNENGTGTLREYPGNVTKLFFKKDAFNSVQRTLTNLPRLLGYNDGHRAVPYRKSYRISNLPAPIRRTLRSSSIKNTDPLYLLRMPHLGVDLSKINDPTILTSLRSLPLGVLLTQFKKLFRQIARIASRNYSHCDVRSLNIMIQPTTGVMTLVDFDWLKPVEELYRTYSFGYYSNPPESLFIMERFQPDLKTNEEIERWLIDSRKASRVRSYIQSNLLSEGNLGALTLKQVATEDSFIDYLLLNNINNYLDLSASTDSRKDASPITSNI